MLEQKNRDVRLDMFYTFFSWALIDLFFVVVDTPETRPVNVAALLSAASFAAAGWSSLQGCVPPSKLQASLLAVLLALHPSPLFEWLQTSLKQSSSKAFAVIGVNEKIAVSQHFVAFKCTA